jgi:lysine 2,3-aminomutase
MSMDFKKVEYRNIPLYSDVEQKDWDNWKWQLSNTIRDIDTLGQVIELSEEERENLSECLTKFKMAITPYYASLMDKTYKRCSIRLQAVPSLEELYTDPSDMDDPLHEDVDSPVPGLTHRYPDRVLLLVTQECSMYCRHCTRRRSVGCDESGFNKKNFLKAVEYIKSHTEVRDVLISGGDPLVLSDANVDYILRTLRQIKTVEIIRIGTRTPVVMPQRITKKLCGIIKKYHPVYINTHFNTTQEITLETKEACERLANVGVNLGNQSVLLKDVNDCPYLMKELVHELLQIRVKPYYIYQCDLSTGISHFRTSVAKGIEIIENLRGHTTGFAVPTFVVDAPGGGGKIPVMPNYVISRSDTKLILRNYEGVVTTYTQPENVTSDCGKCRICKGDVKAHLPIDGVAKLMTGTKSVLQPEGLKRRIRKQDNQIEYINKITVTPPKANQII